MRTLTTALALASVVLIPTAAWAAPQEPATAAPPAEQVSLSGKWTVSTTTDQGPMSSSLDLKHEGTKVSGTISSEMGTNPVAGEYAEGKLSFALNMETGNGPMELWFTGTLQEDGSLAGVIDYGAGTLPWTATRVAAPTPVGRWNMSINSSQGPMSAVLDVKLDGQDVTGTITSDMGTTEIYGTFVEGKLEFAIYMEGGGGSMEIWFTGAMGDDGSTMSGSFDFGQGPSPWTAKKAN